MQVDYNRYGKMEHRDHYERPLVRAAINIRCHHRCRSAVLTALLIAACACVAGALGWLFWRLDTPRIIYHSEGYRLIVSTGEVSVWRGGEELMRGSLGLAASQYFTTSCGEQQTWDTRKYHQRYCEQLCEGDLGQGEAICGVYGRASNLSVSQASPPNNSVSCHTVTWRNKGCQTNHVEDCYCVKPGYWYGGKYVTGRA